MRLFAKLTGGRVRESRASCPREARASARSPVSFSQELDDAIASSIVSPREPNDDGPRVMVMCHALRGAFIFDRDEAARRIRQAFPELDDVGVRRGVRHLETRVRLASMAKPSDKRRASWVHGWMER